MSINKYNLELFQKYKKEIWINICILLRISAFSVIGMNPGYVKVDRSFTDKAMHNLKDYEIFKNIVRLVHSINASVCIEGIEEKEWCECMNDLQVEYLQGYYFGKPCDEKNLLSKLRKKSIIY